MATLTLAGFGPETPTSHLKLLEVIHPQWRSVAVCLELDLQYLVDQQECQGTREVLDPSERFHAMLY